LVTFSEKGYVEGGSSAAEGEKGRVKKWEALAAGILSVLDISRRKEVVLKLTIRDARWEKTLAEICRGCRVLIRGGT